MAMLLEMIVIEDSIHDTDGAGVGLCGWVLDRLRRAFRFAEGGSTVVGPYNE